MSILEFFIVCLIYESMQSLACNSPAYGYSEDTILYIECSNGPTVVEIVCYFAPILSVEPASQHERKDQVKTVKKS